MHMLHIMSKASCMLVFGLKGLELRSNRGGLVVSEGVEGSLTDDYEREDLYQASRHENVISFIRAKVFSILM